MAKDRNGTEIQPGDRVQLDATVVSVYPDGKVHVLISAPHHPQTTAALVPGSATLVIPPMRVTDPNKE